VQVNTGSSTVMVSGEQLWGRDSDGGGGGGGDDDDTNSEH